MRSITWNGQTQFRPGGLTRINANSLAQIGLATNGIIGLVGEADGGQPGTIITIDDPALAKTTFTSGPLANAIKIAFDPSNDPRIPGGAFRCLCIKTNTSTQATKTLLQGANQQVVLNSKDYGVQTNQIGFELEPGISKGSVWTDILSGKSQVSSDVGGKAFLNVEYVGQSTQTVPASGTAEADVNTKHIDDDTPDPGWGVNAFQNYFAYADTSGGLNVANLRKIASNTSGIITTTNDFTNIAGVATAPSAGTLYAVRKGKIHNYTGAALTGAAATITLEAGISFAVNELAGLQIVITAGTGVGQRRIIASNTAGISSTVTVTKDWITIPTGATAYEIRYVTQAQGSFVGASGVATSFQTVTAIDGAAPATVTTTFGPGDDLTKLVTIINATGNYYASIPSGINPAMLVSTFDFDAGNTSVELRNDKGAYTSQPTYTATTPTPWPNAFKRDLQTLIDDINNSAEWITATRSTVVGSGRPDWTSNPAGNPGVIGDSTVYLAGGTRGTSDNTKFQAALDLLLGVRCNFVIPLISQDLTNEGFGSTATFSAVAAQLSAHVDTANGIGKSERGGLLGMKGTRDQIIALGGSLNNADIQLGGQQLKTVDVDGNLTLMDQWSIAVAAAGMRAGAPEVGEPLTHKYIKTFDLKQDSSWDPADRTDANALIGAGILFAEFISGKGTRFVRDLTTHVQDDNLAYMEGSVRDAVRYIAYGHRTLLEDRFTGVKATPANASAIKNTGISYLEQANADNIIVTSYNSSGVLVPGFENYRVTISGDVATIKVQVYPVCGITFQLNDIYLQLPSQSA